MYTGHRSENSFHPSWHSKRRSCLSARRIAAKIHTSILLQSTSFVNKKGGKGTASELYIGKNFTTRKRYAILVSDKYSYLWKKTPNKPALRAKGTVHIMTENKDNLRPSSDAEQPGCAAGTDTAAANAAAAAVCPICGGSNVPP